MKNYKRVVFSSYMDHPLAQLQSLYAAMNFYKDNPKLKEHGGFFTHLLYEKNMYSERLMTQSNKFIIAKDYGFGFQDLLEQENWRIIYDL